MRQASKQYPGLIWQEVFNSESEVRHNGGVPTNVEFRNGKAAYGESSEIIHKLGRLPMVDGLSIRLVGDFSEYSKESKFNRDDSGNYLIWYRENYGWYLRNDTAYPAPIPYTPTENDDIVFVYSKTTYKFLLYAKGIFIGSKALAYGNFDFYNSLLKNVDLDFIEIFNRELSAAEIHNLHHGLEQIDIPRTSLLVDYTSIHGVVENKVKPNPLGLGNSPIVGVFDGGSSAYIDETTPYPELTDFHFKASFKTNSIAVSQAIFSYKNQVESGYRSGWTIRIDNSGRLVFLLLRGLSTATTYISTVGDISINKIYNIEVLLNSGILKIYANDILLTEQTVTYDLFYSNSATYQPKTQIGAQQAQNSSELCFNGQIWDVQLDEILNTTLSGDLIDTVSGLPATNNGVTFQDLTILPTPSNITYDKLGTYFAAIFNGINSKVELGYDPIGTGDITIMGWVNLTSYGESENGRILDNGKFILLVDDNKEIRFTSNGSIIIDSVGDVLSLHKHIFVFIRRQSDGLASIGVAYEDYPLIIVRDYLSSGTPVEGTTNLIIGNNDGDSRSFDGIIPFLRVYQGILPLEYGEQFRTSTLKYLK